MIADCKAAPGIVPYVIGLNHREDMAKENGVEQVPLSYFNSKWNNPNEFLHGTFEK